VGANALRVPLNPQSWLGINGCDPGNNYRTQCTRWWQTPTPRGSTSHWTCTSALPARPKALGQQPMALADHDLDFWSLTSQRHQRQPHRCEHLTQRWVRRACSEVRPEQLDERALVSSGIRRSAPYRPTLDPLNDSVPHDACNRAALGVDLTDAQRICQVQSVVCQPTAGIDSMGPDDR
jgi:hypothetical protein